MTVFRIQILTRKAVERERIDMETARLVAEEEQKKLQRECRRQWAIEQANFACEGQSVDDILRAAKRFYGEAFDEGWSE